MSLPEIALVLATHKRERAEERHAQARAAFLASAAKWDGETAGEFNELLDELADLVAPRAPAPPAEKATKRKLAAVFGSLGLRPQS